MQKVEKVFPIREPQVLSARPYWLLSPRGPGPPASRHSYSDSLLDLLMIKNLNRHYTCWHLGQVSKQKQHVHKPVSKIYLLIRGAAKKKNCFFLGDLSQMWVGGVAYSQTRSKPLQTPPNHPENRLFRPVFHLSFSQISQKPWGGLVGKQIWERSPKKSFFWTPSLNWKYLFG